MNETLFLVIACYNEEEVLPETSKRLAIKMKGLMEKNLISEKSKVVFVNDCSKDGTWELIKRFHNENNLFTGLSLAHNSGEQNAYIAGMMASKTYADMVITMDADLQDDINAIDDMINEYYKGNDIVYGVRSSRKSDSFFKRFPAKVFYKLMKFLGTELIPDHSQYRLMSRRAIEALSEYNEVNVFLPALIPLLGFNSAIVFYERNKRFAGKTKYSFGKLLALFVEGVISFTCKPIQMIGILAGAAAFAAFTGIIVAAIWAARTGTVKIWLIVFISVWSVGALELLAIRIIGEYIGKTYGETKKRPRYNIVGNLMDNASGERVSRH